MSKVATYKHPGQVMDWTNGTGSNVAVGDVISFGTFCGVATVDIANLGTGAVAIDGVYEMPAVNNAAFAQGDVLYFDTVAKNLTKDTSKAFIGIAFRAKAETGVTAWVKIGHEWHDQRPMTLTYANGGSQIAAGAVVKFADFIGIAAEVIAATTGTGEVYVEGAYELTAVNNAAFAAGDLLYVDAAGKLTKVSTFPSIPAGICLAAKAETATKAWVRLGPGIPRLATGE